MCNHRNHFQRLQETLHYTNMSVNTIHKCVTIDFLYVITHSFLIVAVALYAHVFKAQRCISICLIFCVFIYIFFFF